MLVLCAYALGGLAVQTAISSLETKRILQYADNFVCVLFLMDFFISLYRAPDRWKYLARWGWLDLISSIPTVGLLRSGRVARMVRILRVIRGFRATKTISQIILRHRAENTLLALATVVFLVIIFSSAAILQVEDDPSSNIKTAGDALWWALSTITSVGYGDRYPVTPEGRLVATILMFAGVGMFGSLSGLMAAWFLSDEEAEQESELKALRREVSEIHHMLEAMTAEKAIALPECRSGRTEE